MNSRHSLGWKAITDEGLAKEAARIYPDTANPPADRAPMRANWIGAVRWMRTHARFGVDRHVPRRTSPWEWHSNQYQS